MSSDSPGWSDWRRFPDPGRGEFLMAPFGPGVYELRRAGNLLLRGSGKNLAYRMSSLLPAPLGAGTRNNAAKRNAVLEHLSSVEYRCFACLTESEARALERELHRSQPWEFPT